MNEKDLTARARRPYILMTALACLLYFTSYVTRLNYNASLADIVESAVLSKSEAGIVSTALFFSYGAGQIVSGILGDKVRPQWLILAGLILTIACNAVFPLFSSVAPMTAVWTVNGFAQALFWPPLLKLLTQYIPAEKFSLACFAIVAASQIATIVIYLLVPLVLVTLNWKSVFFLAAGFAAAVAAVWIVGLRTVQARYPAPAMPEKANLTADEKGESEENKVRLAPLLIGSGLAFVLVAIAAQGFLKDGLTTWMPTYFAEVFGMETSASILMNVALPVCSIAGVYVITLLYRRFFRNEVKVASVCFAAAAGLSCLLYFFPDRSAAFTLVLSALIVCLMHGINLMLITYAPGRFAASGKVSTVSGITNAATYVGSALSSYGIALIAEKAGWSNTILSWIFIALGGAAVCILCIRRWARFIRKK